MCIISEWLFLITWIVQLSIFTALEICKNKNQYQNYSEFNKKENLVFSWIIGIFLVTLILI